MSETNNQEQPESKQKPAVQVPTELNPQQALSVLIQAVNYAQSKGVYTLEDAGIIDKAVKCFAVKKEEVQPTAELNSEPSEK